jgi:hypothetical protein
LRRTCAVIGQKWTSSLRARQQRANSAAIYRCDLEIPVVSGRIVLRAGSRGSMARAQNARSQVRRFYNVRVFDTGKDWEQFTAEMDTIMHY